jgi:protein-tyrosine phosphatase
MFGIFDKKRKDRVEDLLKQLDGLLNENNSNFKEFKTLFLAICDKHNSRIKDLENSLKVLEEKLDKKSIGKKQDVRKYEEIS